MERCAQSRRERRDESVSFQTSVFLRSSIQARSRALRALSHGRTVGQDSGRSGLRQLADDTGGRAVVNTNGLFEVFEKLQEDLSGYYVLGYYESTEEIPTKPQRVRISVNRPGARADYIERHPQPKPFGTWTQSDRFNHLYHALHADALHRELPVELFYEVFAGADGRPTLFFTASGRLGDLQIGEDKETASRDFSVALRLTRDGSEAAPDYHGREIRVEAPGGRPARGQ